MFQKNCTECKSDISDYNVKEGFIVCFECGTTQENVISESSEWRQFSDNYNTNSIRCSYSKNAIGSELSGNGSNFLHHWNNVSSKQRHLDEIFKELNSLCLPKHIINQSFHLYTKLYSIMLKNNSTKRCTLRQGLKAACVYYTYKQLCIPIEKKNIATLCSTTNKIVTKGCNYFLDVMGNDFIKLDTYTALDFLPKYCVLLNINDRIQDFITKVVIYIKNNDPTFNESTPTSIVCTCIYYIITLLSLDICLDDIHDICGVSMNIIKKHIPQIQKHSEFILNLYKNFVF
jgi:transcription initiation factor TFIIIB Brf1 subunit/transcription initiation factor TFIIB